MRTVHRALPQDYFGESVTETNTVRLMTLSIAEALDKCTENNSWHKHVDIHHLPRSVNPPYASVTSLTLLEVCRRACA